MCTWVNSQTASRSGSRSCIRRKSLCSGGGGPRRLDAAFSLRCRCRSASAAAAALAARAACCFSRRRDPSSARRWSAAYRATSRLGSDCAEGVLQEGACRHFMTRQSPTLALEYSSSPSGASCFADRAC
jgi:hypothetical protein